MCMTDVSKERTKNDIIVYKVLRYNKNTRSYYPFMYHPFVKKPIKDQITKRIRLKDYETKCRKIKGKFYYAHPAELSRLDIPVYGYHVFSDINEAYDLSTKFYASIVQFTIPKNTLIFIQRNRNVLAAVQLTKPKRIMTILKEDT